ncbi:hypothetical protein LMH87_000057 [Akanthomyces muscarius]|uniref:Uncharacterized protein n=1 Tax=Akanthomyces muscarius TaxID=2231603 RepID=A0A9W8QEP9_AKAMU|nr:hypothetical protein LMH87_000057 [Akanthomyces muscarius]KAJ4154779.1 hypothetical protein LMH87_000057 [Akanthomyces muscarius]
MEPLPGSKAVNGIDEYIWNHTFVITTERLVVGKGVLIMVFDSLAMMASLPMYDYDKSSYKRFLDIFMLGSHLYIPEQYEFPGNSKHGPCADSSSCQYELATW